MQLIWCEDARALAARAASKVIDLLSHKPDATLALPTGLTPLGLYAQLRSRFERREVSFAQAKLFNLDEYAGLPSTDTLSYAHFLRSHLIDRVDARPENVRLLRGDAADAREECRQYDEAIRRSGGLDLAILGLGTNGHIAFNEPGADWSSSTHTVELTPATRAVHFQQQAGRPGIPGYGITMGVGTIRAARQVLLLVVGEAKRPALAALRRGIPDAQWPVTSLLDHPDLTVMCDAILRET